jgi:hypothetical protein
MWAGKSEKYSKSLERALRAYDCGDQGITHVNTSLHCGEAAQPWSNGGRKNIRIG